jgi:hypothetical protein
MVTFKPLAVSDSGPKKMVVVYPVFELLAILDFERVSYWIS